MLLPDGKVVDVLSSALDEIYSWIQDETFKPESGGYIVGYEHIKTGNISLEAVSIPASNDYKNRIRFSIRDIAHQLFISKSRRHKSYYMGVWHSHPQIIPEPSTIDWDDWKLTMEQDKTGSRYCFFIITGTEEWRIWAGDLHSGNIVELHECEMGNDGLYIDRRINN